MLPVALRVGIADVAQFVGWTQADYAQDAVEEASRSV